jgi:hypothetical protein
MRQRAAPAAGVDEPGSTQRLSRSVVKVSRACLEGRGESLDGRLACDAPRETTRSWRKRAATPLQTNSSGRIFECEADDASVPEIPSTPQKTAETRMSSVMSQPQRRRLRATCSFCPSVVVHGSENLPPAVPSVPRRRGTVHIYIDRTLDVRGGRSPSSREQSPSRRLAARARRAQAGKRRANR